MTIADYKSAAKKLNDFVHWSKMERDPLYRMLCAVPVRYYDVELLSLKPLNYDFVKIYFSGTDTIN